MLSREYGAWAMLLIPFLIGLASARNLNIEAALLLVAVVALFSLNYTTQIYLRTRSGRALKWSILYSMVTLASATPLLLIFKLEGLLPLAVAAAIPLLIHLLLYTRRLERSSAGELLAVAGLTLSAPASLYTATGSLDLNALLLWFYVFLFFGESVFYVKMKSSDRKLKEPPKGLGERLRRGKATLAYYAILLSTVALLGAGGFSPLPVILAYIPTSLKALDGVFRVKVGQPIRKVGFLQMAHALLFLAILPPLSTLLP